MNSESFLDTFNLILNSGLPGELAHKEVLPINRKYTSEALKFSNSFRQSAVGILLYPKDSSIHSILIQRPEYDGNHSNQLAFPGGKMDPDDPDLIHTARRECFEEVALPFGTGKLIGELTQVYIPVSNFLVQPYLFFMEELPPLTPDQREVKSIISFDIFKLTKDEILKSTDIHISKGLIRKNVPYYDINGHIVWGATAMMLSELKVLLKQF